MATFFSAPAPLIQTGLMPAPHVPAGSDLEYVARMSASELEEFFLRVLLITHPGCLMLTLAGYEVLQLWVAEFVESAGSGDMGVLDMQTQEISTAENPIDYSAQGYDVSDGMWVVLEIRADPSLSNGPVSMTGLYPGYQVDTQVLGAHLTEDRSDTWEVRLPELLQLYAEKSAAWEATLRADLYNAMPEHDVRGWLRTGWSGRLNMYDYTAWDTAVLEARKPAMARPLENVGKTVWEAVTDDRDDFYSFVEAETTRVTSSEGLAGRNLFPGVPSVNAYDLMFEVAGPGLGASLIRHNLTHFPNAATIASLSSYEEGAEVPPGPLIRADLELMSYTEVLLVMSETGAAVLGTELSGDALREQLEERLAEANTLATSLLASVQQWQEDNYRDLAESLAGDIPANPGAGQGANALFNALGTGGGVAAEKLFIALGASIGTAVAPGVGTFVGAVVGFSISTVLGSMAASHSAWASELSAVAQSQRVLRLSEALIGAVRDAHIEATAELTRKVAEIEAKIADPAIGDDDLRAEYAAILSDLEAFGDGAPEGFAADRSLADRHIYLWVAERGWGLSEPGDGWFTYRPEGGWGDYEPGIFEWGSDEGVHTSTNRALFALLRERALPEVGSWSKWTNPDLFVDQLEFEWRCLGLDFEQEIETMRAGLGSTPEENYSAFRGTTVTFEGLSVPDALDPMLSHDDEELPPGVVFTWEDKLREYAGSLPDYSAFDAAPEEFEGTTVLTSNGIDAIANGNFTLACTLELDVDLNSCRVRSLSYRFTFADDTHAEIYVPVPGDPDPEWYDPRDYFESFTREPNDYYDFTVEVVSPFYGGSY